MASYYFVILSVSGAGQHGHVWAISFIQLFGESWSTEMPEMPRSGVGRMLMGCPFSGRLGRLGSVVTCKLPQWDPGQIPDHK